MPTVLDSINAIAAADAAVASAQVQVQAAQAAAAAANAAVTDAQAADTAADQQLSADLHSGGPAFVLNQDGSATGYSYDASNPAGFDTVQYQPAGAVSSSTPSTPSTPPATS